MIRESLLGLSTSSWLVCNTNDDYVTRTHHIVCVQGYCAASPNGKKKLQRKEKSKKHVGKKKTRDKSEKKEKELNMHT